MREETGARGTRRGRNAWITPAALGAVAMYYSDPERGRRRRVLVLDKIRHYGLKAMHGADLAARDLSNRMVGLQARMGGMLRSRRNDAADDSVLAARVRARLGRTISHPHAVRVAVHQGQLELEGPILAHEHRRLLDTVQRTPGIKGIADRLQIHEQAQGIPSLQGGNQRTGMHPEFLQRNWAPAVRGTAVLAGATMGWMGMTRRSPAGLAFAAAGLGLLLRGLTNMPVRQLAGLGASPRAIELQKTIRIQASPEVVFDAWARAENFPHCMSHVLEVRPIDERRSHWTVQGPMGSRLEWDAVVTESVRPSLLAWKTEPGSAVEHTGMIRFEPVEGGTRVSVKMSYSPPAGALGHGVAAMLGADPKHELDDDLMRMKNFIETGNVPHDAAAQQAAHAHAPYSRSLH